VGSADKPYTRADVDSSLQEIADFVSVLDTALPAHNLEVIDLAADAVGNEWRELGENFPEATNPSVSGGRTERAAARRAVLAAALSLRQIAMAAEAGDYATATQVYADYRQAAAATRPILKAAEPWSLFNPDNRRRYLASLNALDALATASPGR
jgi:hypothetical protein